MTSKELMNILLITLSVFIVLVVILTIAFIAYISHKHKKKYNDVLTKRQQEWENRIKNVDNISYTQIINSSNETYGNMSMYQGSGYGSIKSINITKFLIVYKNGKQEIYSVADDTELCRLYTQLLKKE